MTGAVCLGLLVPVAAVGAGPASADVTPVSLGSAWQSPASPPDSSLALVGADDGSGTQQAEAAAVTLAKKTGKAQVVAAAMTQTSQVTAEPNGTLVADQNVLPVRVRSGESWTEVSTRLARASSGRLAAAALPGDAVSFSGGGTGPMAVLADGSSSMSLWWPGRLPAPAVSGASAQYANVLPGVTLVLTATSAQAGGFSTNLVISSAKAARDPRLAKLGLRVSGSGTGALRPVAGGGLAAPLKGGRGWFAAPAPRMWDSSALLPGASRASVKAVARSAGTAGAGLASAGLGPKSTTAGPAAGALVAPVKASVSGTGGSELSLAPDEKMLTAPGVKFPVYVDPSFTTLNGTGGKQAFDAVLSDSGTGTCGPYQGVCDSTNCRGSHYNSSSYSGGMPVGYDNFEAGQCEFNDTDYALYQVGIPNGPFGANSVLIDASFKTDVVYSSSCASATVTASWIGAIGSGTGWPGPGIMADNSNATASAGYNGSSCNGVEDTGATAAVGFNVTSDLKHMTGSPGNITLRVWENGDSNENDHKQFASNPTLQATWTVKPRIPSSLSASAVSGGDGASLGCDSSSTDPNIPRIGKTDSSSGVGLAASYSDYDGAAVQANIRYETETGGTWSAWTTKAGVLSSVGGGSVGLAPPHPVSWTLPSSVTSTMADGTVIGWEAQAETGSGSVDGSTWGPYSSSWSPECYFKVYPDAPDAPSLSVAGVDLTVPQTVGTKLNFTITQTGTDTDTEFVWGLDQTAPVGGTIPPAQACTAASTTCKVTTTNGVASATLAITVPANGPHDLNVYAVDAAGNESGPTNGAPGPGSASGQTWSFSGADPAPPSPFTSGGTLQANFDTALSQKASYDNTMISTQAGTPGAADADGNGDAFDEAQLASAGWKSGGTVTVDGATFTLPRYGTTADTADNLLAFGQTIGTGASGIRGGALVFLATSSNGNAQVDSSVGTGSPDAGGFASDATAPYTPTGYGVTGANCSQELTQDTTTPCDPATGTISYASGCTPTAPTGYTLAVPNWMTGPADTAAVFTADRDTPSGQLPGTGNPKVYAFAVPLDPDCTVTSVQLPDVGDAVNVPVATGTGQHEPALHILGMAVRDTTTTTPATGTTAGGATGTEAGTAVSVPASPSAPSGTAWTGAWESPIEDAFAPPAGDTWGNQTMRTAFSPNMAVPAGSTVRVRLSSPGFLSGDGDAPVQVKDATVGPQASAGGASLAAAPQALTFGGSASVTIPAGGDVYSDPVTLTGAISGRAVLSLQLANSSLPVLPLNSYPAAARTWFAPSSDGDQTSAQSDTDFTYAVNAVPLLTGFDVATPAAAYNSVSYPGEPTVVVAGNNVIDGTHASAPSDSGNTPSSWLAGQLYSQGAASGYGVTDAGLQSNDVLTDGQTAGAGLAGGVPDGMSLLARIDRDVLAEPGLGTVVIDQGLEDLLAADGSAATSANLEDAYSALLVQLQDFGAGEVIFGTLTPCGGFTDSTDSQSCDTATDTARTSVNDTMSNGTGFCTADFSAAVASSGTTSPVALASANDAGDHVNLTAGTGGGYAALGSEINLDDQTGVCSLEPPLAPSSP